MRSFGLFLASAALIASPLLAQTSAPAGQSAPAAATPGATPNVTAGAKVSDAAGALVGTVEAVAGGTATISTGTAKAALPLTSFAQGPDGLVIGMTKVQLEAAVAQAAPATIAVGAVVNDSKGGKVGTVESVSGDLVVVATANTKAQLPKSAFAQSPSGLVIGMTMGELEAAAKASGAAAKSSSGS